MRFLRQFLPFAAKLPHAAGSGAAARSNGESASPGTNDPAKGRQSANLPNLRTSGARGADGASHMNAHD